MKKRALTAAMALALVMAMTGCGNTGAQTESATAATTQEAAAEVAAEEEWMTDPTAYLSGINAADYVDLPANYSSLTVEVEPVKEVTDEEVEEMIDKLREAHRELKEVTNRKKVKEGDVVNIDYVGRIDGEEFDGGAAEGYDLEIGSDSFIDGFEDGLIGQTVGDTVTLELTFPENYGDSTKAGVDAEFDVTINSIQQFVVPDLTDQFVVELGFVEEPNNVPVTTVEELRTYERNQLVESGERDYTRRFIGAIKKALLANAVFKKDVPAAMVERKNETFIREITAEVEKNYGEIGVTDIRSYCIAKDLSEDAFMQDIMDMAVNEVKTDIILYAIGDKEGLLLTDDDFEAASQKWASFNGYTSVEEIPEESVEAYRESLDLNEVLYFLRSKTSVVAPAAQEGATAAEAATEEAAQ
jgi:trigger factor